MGAVARGREAGHTGTCPMSPWPPETVLCKGRKGVEDRMYLGSGPSSQYGCTQTKFSNLLTRRWRAAASGSTSRYRHSPSRSRRGLPWWVAVGWSREEQERENKFMRRTRTEQRTGSPIGDLSRNYASFAKIVAFKASFCIQIRLFGKKI